MAPSPEQMHIPREQNALMQGNRHSLNHFLFDKGQRERQGLFHLSSASHRDQSTEADHLPEDVQLNRVPNVCLS